MSRPSTRMVGDPKNRVCLAACWSQMSISRTSALQASSTQTCWTSAIAASRWGQPGVVSTSTRGGRWAGAWPAGLVAGSLGLRDAAAGGHLVDMVVQQPLGQVQRRGDPLVGRAVVDDPVLAAGGDEPAPAQAGQVVGDRGLRLAELAGHLAGGQFPLGREQPRMRRRVGSPWARKCLATRSVLAGVADRRNRTDCTRTSLHCPVTSLSLEES